MKTSLIATTIALALQAGQAHVHGSWSMLAAQEGKQLQITITGPLEDVLGFEHAPKTDAEREAVEAFEAKILKQPPLVVPDTDAQCSLVGKPALLLPKGFDHEGHDHDEDHDKDDDHDDDDDHDHDEEHDHDEDHDHDEHHGDEEHGHGEADITYTFTCSQPGDLKSISFMGFKAFPSIKTVDAVLLQAGGQSAAKLTKSKSVLRVQ